MHIDPLGTSAWNTLIRGRKRWALFHPSLSKSTVKAKHLMRDGEDDEAIDWFSNLLPRLKQANSQMPVVEFIQCVGLARAALVWCCGVLWGAVGVRWGSAPPAGTASLQQRMYCSRRREERQRGSWSATD